MVFPNSLLKSDGNYQSLTPRRPRKCRFDIGEYSVSVHREGGSFYSVAIWDDKLRIGTVNLARFYTDVDTIYGVDTHIREDYQGIGIGYRAYTLLVKETNISLASITQSAGAIKLWRKFAANDELKIYFVASGEFEPRLFDSDVFETKLVRNRLRGIKGSRTFDPYKMHGVLLLVNRSAAMDQMIQDHMRLREKAHVLKRQFKQYDCHKLLKW